MSSVTLKAKITVIAVVSLSIGIPSNKFPSSGNYKFRELQVERTPTLDFIHILNKNCNIKKGDICLTFL